MKKYFFIKNFILFISPFLVLLFLFVTFTIISTQKFIINDIDKNNLTLLKQIQQNVELIMDEIAQQMIFFNNNDKAILTMKSLIGENNMTLDRLNSYGLIDGFIRAPANSKPYIHSIYVYLENDKDLVFSSNEGLVSIRESMDKSWYEIYKSKDINARSWTELRNIKNRSFEKNNTKILSIYRRLDNTKGVIVLNILADYFNNTLASLTTLPDQGIFIVNEKNNVIFSNKTDSNMFQNYLPKIAEGTDSIFTIDTKSAKYTVNQLISSNYNWKYISLIPQSTLYEMPIKLITYALTVMVIAFVFGFILIYYLTHKNYRQVSNIISILSSAEKGLTLPPPPDKIKDEYGYIIHNILKTFIEQSYLKIQLSEKKYRMEALELLALQSQMNPHFLLNTLETVNWESLKLMRKTFREDILIEKLSGIHYMIENLSDILKYALGNPHENVTLETEISNTKSYIEIQKYRYEDKFDVIWDCENTAMNYMVIKLFLQPLIENSIYHGIKEKDKNCLIKIKIKKSGSILKISVVDNGIGVNLEKLDEIRRKLESVDDYSEHIGLYNTSKRLKLKYGDRYKLSIRSKYNLGTAIYIEIPIS